MLTGVNNDAADQREVSTGLPTAVRGIVEPMACRLAFHNMLCLLCHAVPFIDKTAISR
jgi:hypothetical protein